MEWATQQKVNLTADSLTVSHEAKNRVRIAAVFKTNRIADLFTYNKRGGDIGEVIYELYYRKRYE